MSKRLLFLAALVVSTGASAAGGGVPLEHVEIDLQNQAALQRGARMFVNYCSGCHSLQYMRYSRLAQDLGLTEEQVVDNLIFDRDQKVGDLMTIAMAPEDAEAWFGAKPPDLSVTSRSRGSDWLYSFLKSYYVDPSRPSGWNNVVFANTSMPHPLWELQGIYVLAGSSDEGEEGESAGEAEPVQGTGAAGEESHASLTRVQPGQLSAEEYDATIKDLVTFLEYAGEPAALKRASLGVWVLLYLAIFTVVAFFLKKEFWRDVH